MTSTTKGKRGTMRHTSGKVAHSDATSNYGHGRTAFVSGLRCRPEHRDAINCAARAERDRLERSAP